MKGCGRREQDGWMGGGRGGAAGVEERREGMASTGSLYTIQVTMQITESKR